MTAAAAALSSAAERFLSEEGRMIDSGRYDDWLALFDEDAIYWVPAAAGQTDPLNHVSIIYDDKPVLAMRVNRLAHPRVYAMEPAPQVTHLVSGVTASERADGLCDIESAFVMTEVRDGRTRVFSGRYVHLLRPAEDGGFRIKSKRVDLMDCDGVHGLITVPF